MLETNTSGRFDFFGLVRNRPFEVQLFCLRVYVGIDLIHRFAEKSGLLGSAAKTKTLAAFGMLVPFPGVMLVVAALCEFAAFVGFTLGLFTRAAAVGTATYILVAAEIGHHFSMGFTWNAPGGGWEYPAFWAFVCLGFVLTGGGPWSLDRLLVGRPSSPRHRNDQRPRSDMPTL